MYSSFYVLYILSKHGVYVTSNAGVMSIMFLYYSEEQTVKGSEVQAHTMDTNLISTGEFLMKFPSVQEHMPASCQDEFFKVGTSNLYTLKACY